MMNRQKKKSQIGQIMKFLLENNFYLIEFWNFVFFAILKIWHFVLMTSRHLAFCSRIRLGAPKNAFNWRKIKKKIFLWHWPWWLQNSLLPPTRSTQTVDNPSHIAANAQLFCVGEYSMECRQAYVDVNLKTEGLFLGALEKAVWRGLHFGLHGNEDRLIRD